MRYLGKISDNKDLVTKEYVEGAISELPSPMVFKGTLGTNGTITSLPSASTSNEGFTYKVITARTYAGQAAKVGDVFISNGVEWTLVPSGDEPSGTVTNVATGTGLTGGPITSTGTISVNFNSVQAKLPSGQNDTYLHLNENTGAIEWSEVQTGEEVPDNIVLADGETIAPREIGNTFSGHTADEFLLKTEANTTFATKSYAATVGPVTSVNGDTGAITGLATQAYAATVGPVTSVNGNTGVITGLATETYADQHGPVTSVNGSTGVITGLATQAYAATVGPVTSVNNQTGAVSLSFREVPTCSSSDNGKFLRVVSGVATWQALDSAEAQTF